MKLKHACKKGVTLVLAGLMAAATLTACGSGSESTATAGAESVTTETSTSSEATESTAVTESDETLVMILETEPKTLTNLNNASTLQVFPEAIGDSLLRYNDETKTADPCLAESYEMIDDTHYRFHLREDAVYSDGTPVTADDVLYSLTQYKEVGVQDALMIDPANCVVEDEHTFVLALETYKLGWEFCVAQGTTAIYSEAAVEAAGGVDAAGFAPVGCGRYKVSEWKPGEYLLVERNENYWDPDFVGYYKYIKFMFVSDSASRVMAVRSGDADIANRISAADYISLQNDPAAYGWAYDAGVVNNLYFNNEEGACTDEKLREAICYAIDPEAVNAVMNLGMGEVAQGLWPKSFPFYRDYYGKTLYDPEKAKQLLAEAGYASGLTLDLPVLSTFKDAATVVQENLRNVGVEVNVSVLDNATWTGLARGGDYDMLLGNTAIASVNATMFNHVDPAKIGISAFSIRVDTPAINEGLALANSTDEANQEEGFDKLYDEIFSNYYVLGLCNGNKYMAVKNGVTGLRVSNTYGYVDVSECHPE